MAAASAPRLAEALSVIERFAHVRAPYFRLGSEARDRDFELRVEPQLRLEPANFGRACRRWFGSGPRAYRNQPVRSPAP